MPILLWENRFGYRTLPDMTRFKVSTLSAAILTAGFAIAAPLFTAPTASANCSGGAQWDPVTGNCWTSQDRNSMGTSGGSQGCRPGELGNCLGAMQNAITPGATLPSPSDPEVVAAPRMGN